MKNFSLLIKPASSGCNLHCGYCFYHSLAESRETSCFGKMSLDTLEKLVEKSLRETTRCCTFSFQGGEPTLAGLDFYKKLIDFEHKYNVNGAQVQNVIQTNGTLLDEEWAEFLAKNQFLVGLSLDGTSETHNRYRTGPDGGSHKSVMRAVRLLNEYKVEYNILCVVTKFTAAHAAAVYSFFKKNGFKYLQFIPCLDPLGDEMGTNEYSLSPSDYENFLKRIYDCWERDIRAGNGVSIRYFDNLADILLGYPPEACNMRGHCTCQYVVEADGSVYPCDFYALDEWRLGNAVTDDFAKMASSDRCREFISIGSRLHPDCKECRWYSLCRGGCRRERRPENGELKNYYCSAYKGFFEYAVPGLRAIVRALVNN